MSTILTGLLILLVIRAVVFTAIVKKERRKSR